MTEYQEMLRRVQRELVDVLSGYHRGVIACAGWYAKKYGIFLGGIGPASYTDNPNQIIGQCRGDIALLDLVTQKPVWIYKGDAGVGQPVDADFNWENGHTVVGCMTGVAELDEKGNVVRKFTASNLGAFNDVYAARWVRGETDLVALCEHRNHIAGVFNLATGAYEWTFGEFGVPGSDDTHLSYPRGINQYGKDKVVVCDHGNSRVAIVEKAAAITEAVLYSVPSGIDIFDYPVEELPRALRGLWAVSTYHNTLQPLTYLMVEVPALPDFYGIVPERTEKVRLNPHLHGYVVCWGQFGVLMEEDWRFKSRRDYYARGGLDIWAYPPYSLGAGEAKETTPIVGIGHRKQLVRVWSSQPATLYIEVPRPKYRANVVPYGFTWKEYDSVPINADKEVGYILTAPPAVWRASVVMGATAGEIDLSLEGWL